MGDGPFRRSGASRPARVPPRAVSPARVPLRVPAVIDSAQSPPRKRSHTLMGVAPPNAALPPVAGRPSMPSLAIDAEPTVLVVGDGLAHPKALEEALAAHGIYCETASAKVAAYTALAVAPDIVLLVGDAAGEHYDEMLGLLRGALRERMPPVVVVTAAQDLASRLQAFRCGAVAAFTDADAPELLAGQIAQLIQDLSSPRGHASATLGEASLDELLAVLSKELRAELCQDGAPRSGPVRLVLGGGKPLAIALHEFIGRVKRHVVSATALPAEPIRQSVAEALPEAEPRPPGDIAGMRMIVADEDAGRADIVAQALRARGATVLVTNLSPSATRLQRLRRLDPAVLLTGENHILGRGLTLVRAAREDCRLRWASLIVLRWEEVWPDESDAPAIEPLLGTLAALSDLEHGVEQRVTAGLSFDLRLESIGPVRLLRAVGGCAQPTRIRVDNPRIQAEVELCAGNVVAARAQPADGASQLSGLDALSALSVLHSGRVSVAPRATTETPRPLGSVDELLARMDGERPPVAPSLFPEALGGVLPQSLRAPAPAQLVVQDQPARVPPPPVEPEPQLILPPARRALRLLATPLSFGALMVPLWVTLACGVALAFSLLFGVIAISRAGAPPAPAPPLASAAPTPAPEEASVPERTRSLLERARDGDESALESLQVIPADKRSAEQAFALSQGRHAQRQRELGRLMDAIENEPVRLRERETQRQLLRAARDPVTGAETLRRLAAIDAPESVDLIYETWAGTPGKSQMTELAESLVFSERVRKRASPALAVALDLRTAESCEVAKLALSRAVAQADRRSLRPLSRLVSQRGCGPAKAADCYPCLRSQDTLRKAITAARSRRAPI
jgi:CheY-like chemotaxis protein